MGVWFNLIHVMMLLCAHPEPAVASHGVAAHLGGGAACEDDTQRRTKAIEAEARKWRLLRKAQNQRMLRKVVRWRARYRRLQMKLDYIQNDYYYYSESIPTVQFENLEIYQGYSEENNELRGKLEGLRDFGKFRTLILEFRKMTRFQALRADLLVSLRAFRDLDFRSASPADLSTAHQVFTDCRRQFENLNLSKNRLCNGTMIFEKYDTRIREIAARLEQASPQPASPVAAADQSASGEIGGHY